MITATDQDTIGAQFIRQDGLTMAYLLGGLSATCKLSQEEADNVCKAWGQILEREYGKNPQGRFPVAEHRKLYRLFVEQVTAMLDRAEGKS